MITKDDFVRYRLSRIKAAWGFFDRASAATGIPASILAAVASRETGVRNISGDSGYGTGVMQIDKRYHAFAKTQATWDWMQNIMYGAKLLAANIKEAQAAGVDEFNALRCAVAGYNQGMSKTSGAIADYRRYGDPDKTTTGGDYSKDVLRQAAWIEELVPAASSGKKKTNLWWMTGLTALLL
jgi:membrane-bound lytic murein transglycosylase MltF